MCLCVYIYVHLFRLHHQNSTLTIDLCLVPPRLPVCLSLCLSVCLYVCLSIYLSIYLSLGKQCPLCPRSLLGIGVTKKRLQLGSRCQSRHGEAHGNTGVGSDRHASVRNTHGGCGVVTVIVIVRGHVDGEDHAQRNELHGSSYDPHVLKSKVLKDLYTWVHVKLCSTRTSLGVSIMTGFSAT